MIHVEDESASILIAALCDRILILESEGEVFEAKWRTAGELANAEREGRQAAARELEDLRVLYGELVDAGDVINAEYKQHDLDRADTNLIAREIVDALRRGVMGMEIERMISRYTNALAKERESTKETP